VEPAVAVLAAAAAADVAADAGYGMGKTASTLAQSCSEHHITVTVPLLPLHAKLMWQGHISILPHTATVAESNNV
jgi:hypothetical protein